jgi:hypothetical protein
LREVTGPGGGGCASGASLREVSGLKGIKGDDELQYKEGKGRGRERGAKRYIEERHKIPKQKKKR